MGDRHGSYQTLNAKASSVQSAFACESLQGPVRLSYRRVNLIGDANPCQVSFVQLIPSAPCFYSMGCLIA